MSRKLKDYEGTKSENIRKQIHPRAKILPKRAQIFKQGHEEYPDQEIQPPPELRLKTRTGNPVRAFSTFPL